MGSQGGIVIVLYYNNITNHDWFFLVPTNFLNSNYMSDTGVCKLVIIYQHFVNLVDWSQKILFKRSLLNCRCCIRTCWATSAGIYWEMSIAICTYANGKGCHFWWASSLCCCGKIKVIVVKRHFFPRRKTCQSNQSDVKAQLLLTCRNFEIVCLVPQKTCSLLVLFASHSAWIISFINFSHLSYYWVVSPVPGKNIIVIHLLS